ncbi:MAG: N-acetylneuraminate synthase family protein [Pseudomonadota bacterium]
MTALGTAKPYIIAEIGSNWSTLNDAVQSIAQAKAAGADAVKFQAFDMEALYGMKPGTLPDHLRGRGIDMPTYWLPLAWLPKLKEKADACGIELLCTAFSPELVAAVDPFVTAHKIASSDATWPQLLSAVAACGKPVLLSTGAKNLVEIEHALRFCPTLSPTYLLYCVSAYPARMVNLVEMTVLAQRFKRRVGFSDHTLDIVGAPYQAVLAGACVIEKHFTAFPEMDTPDRPHSLKPDEFHLMVQYLRGERRPEIAPKIEERDTVLRHNRRLVATRDIAEGEELRYGVNFGAYRALHDDTRGLSPFAWELVEGKRAAGEIARGAGIGPGDIA